MLKDWNIKSKNAEYKKIDFNRLLFFNNIKKKQSNVIIFDF